MNNVRMLGLAVVFASACSDDESAQVALDGGRPSLHAALSNPFEATTVHRYPDGGVAITTPSGLTCSTYASREEGLTVVTAEHDGKLCAVIASEVPPRLVIDDSRCLELDAGLGPRAQMCLNDGLRGVSGR